MFSQCLVERLDSFREKGLVGPIDTFFLKKKTGVKSIIIFLKPNLPKWNDYSL